MSRHVGHGTVSSGGARAEANVDRRTARTLSARSEASCSSLAAWIPAPAPNAGRGNAEQRDRHVDPLGSPKTQGDRRVARYRVAAVRVATDRSLARSIGSARQSRGLGRGGGLLAGRRVAVPWSVARIGDCHRVGFVAFRGIGCRQLFARG